MESYPKYHNKEVRRAYKLYFQELKREHPILYSRFLRP